VKLASGLELDAEQTADGDCNDVGNDFFLVVCAGAIVCVQARLRTPQAFPAALARRTHLINEALSPQLLSLALPAGQPTFPIA